MFTLIFWKDAAERALTTAAEVVLGFLVIGSTAIADVDWAHIGSVAAVAAGASVLKSLVASNIGESRSASLVSLDGPRHAKP